MKRPRGPAAEPPLPVDTARLRCEFPSLTDDDVQAYVAVTRRILAAPPELRGRVTREILEQGRLAQEEGRDVLARHYLVAVKKMQRRDTR